MKLNKMTFTEAVDAGEVYATPETVTVTMSIKEAIWIAKLAGKQVGGDGTSSSIYSCLTGEVFNRWWDDGVTGANKDFPTEVPPIVYEKDVRD